MSSILDRIASVELKKDSLDVPEWGVLIGVREMTARERNDFGENCRKQPTTATVRLVIDCAFDPENGKPLFEKAHQDMLLSKSGAAVERIAKRIVELSGMTDDSAKEIEKN